MEVDNKVEFGWHLYTYLLKIQNSKKRNYSILKIKSGVSSSIILVKTLMVFHHWKHQFRFRSFSASVIWKMEFANSVTINKYLPGTNEHANTHKTVFVFNIVRLAHAQKSPLVPGDVRSSPPDWRLPAPGPELSSVSTLRLLTSADGKSVSRPGKLPSSGSRDAFKWKLLLEPFSLKLCKLTFFTFINKEAH